MECNKEEAIRAKEIAEKKMQNKDFVGARRIALKAQQLFPDLDNITQMLSVCDVHCSAECRVGIEIDWYGVLQIEQSANEALIKRQFRKFALLLHPDKNKFPGAESAFKLIGEAQRELLDVGRRSLYDIRYKAYVRRAEPTQSTQHPSKNSNVGNNTTKRSTSQTTQQWQPKQQSQTANRNCSQTFWTTCPSCAVKYQYYREVVNKPLRCQNCTKTFIANDISVQGASPGTNCSQPASLPPKSHGSVKVGPQSINGNLAANGDIRGKPGVENSKTEFSPKTRCAPENCGNKDVKANSACSNEVKPAGKVSGKRRRKQVSESSETCDIRSSANPEKEFIQEGDNSIGYKRSQRNKRDRLCAENLSNEKSSAKKLRASTEDENEDRPIEGELPKMNDVDRSAAATKEDVEWLEQKRNACFKERLPDGSMDIGKTGEEKVKDDGIKKCSEAINDSASYGNPERIPEPESYTVFEPDFSNFDKEEGCFKVGQIWACYDTVDAMPRFYARIRKVTSPGFKLKVIWLEPDPDKDNEVAWVDEGLPVACGKFEHGNYDDLEDPLIFSHLICWEKGSSRGSYIIYPRIGETWALFKNWDIKWKSDLNSKRMNGFEFVEILSEYVEDYGILVAHLGKVEGFSCLFCRTVKDGVDSFQIPSSQLFRFSHRVPSFKMTGEEREDVPKGSFELDPASLPADLEEIALPKKLEVETGHTHPNGLCYKASATVEKSMGSNGSASRCQVQEAEANSNPKGSSGVVTESHNAAYFSSFDMEEGCFKVGHVWACYDTVDLMPRFYALINKVITPGFKLKITWLEPDPDDDNEIAWVNEGLPVACGKFKHGNDDNLEDPLMFSHLINWEKGSSRDSYLIYPKMGETWALFKDWDIKWKSDVNGKRTCEFEFVEILSDYVEYLGIFVAHLGKVKGFSCLFCRTVKGGVDSFQIPSGQLFRFSHRVPSFKMTGEEREDVPKGSFELDPASLPTNLEEIGLPKTFEGETGRTQPNGSWFKASAADEKSVGSNGSSPPLCHVQDAESNSNPRGSSGTVSTPETFEIPDPEFHDFDADKSIQNLRVGQIWAFYSDEDSLPKYYGQIRKIDSNQDFSVHVAWLEGCSVPKHMIRSRNLDIPICCGRFKCCRGQRIVFEGMDSFCHQPRVEPTDKQGEYMILPREGEVWALYKHWDADTYLPDLCNCEYEIVEILGENGLSRKTLVLERVEHFKAVFKARVRGKSQATMEIPEAKLLRFSHRIPAFKLTKERDGSLCGFWELDPAALPISYFCSK